MTVFYRSKGFVEPLKTSIGFDLYKRRYLKNILASLATMISQKLLGNERHPFKETLVMDDNEGDKTQEETESKQRKRVFQTNCEKEKDDNIIESIRQILFQVILTLFQL